MLRPLDSMRADIRAGQSYFLFPLPLIILPQSFCGISISSLPSQQFDCAMIRLHESRHDLTEQAIDPIFLRYSGAQCLSSLPAE